MINLTGLTLIKNGNKLKYPWKECITSMASYCSQVLVATSPGDDDTLTDLRKICEEYPWVKFVLVDWPDKNTGDGSVLAKVVNELIPFVENDWIIYLQADEFIHEANTDIIKNHIRYCQYQDRAITQIELFRTYFWKNLQTRDTSNELYLGRVFRKGSHTVGGDGMFLIRKYGQILRTNIPIYHYSRIGTEEDVTRRIRNLDSLFHDKDHIDSLESFKYTSTSNLVSYTGSHPKIISKFYSEYM
jgi:hypothetical protein